MKKTVQLLIIFSTFIIKVLTCNLPETERFSCGKNISTEQDCLALNCCYDGKAVGNNPKCYFPRKEAAGSPIRYPNGLCIYPKDGTGNITSLVWSTRCSNKNAFFLVHRDHSIYHTASGKCVMPRNGNGPDPGTDAILVLSSKNCGAVRFEAARNGNLAYFYSLYPIYSCIGEGQSSVSPKVDDLVKISKKACVNDERRHHLKYVYQKTAKEGVIERLTCPKHSAIHITWAYYGQLREGLPVGNKEEQCKTNAIDKIQKECNGKSYCFYEVRDSFFGVNCHGVPKHSLVRYTCEWNLNSVQTTDQFGQNISFTSFNIRLNRLKTGEKYIQIIVMEVQSKNIPNSSPNYYKPDDLSTKNKQPNAPYITAELSMAYVDTHPSFTVGTGQYINDRVQHTGFLNAKLEHGANYTLFIRTYIKEDSYHDSNWMQVIQTKHKDDIPLSGISDGEYEGCLKVKDFLKTWKDFIFIGIMGFQFIIIIIFGFLVLRKFCQRHCKKSEKGEDSAISRNEEKISKKVEQKPQRVSHQYEYPSLGCRRQPCDHNVVNEYDDFRVESETEYEHVYHSLKTL